MTDENVQSGVAYFNRYDRSFQEKILQALLTDCDWAAQMVEVMTPDYFELKYLHYLAVLYFDHYKKHRTFPTIPLIASIAKDNLRSNGDQILKQQVVEYLHRIKFSPNLGDLNEVKERSIEFCRKQAMKKALTTCVDLIEDGKSEEIIEIVKKALSVGIPSSTGYDFFKDFEARFALSTRVPIPTGIPQLDRPDVLAGGLARGELGVVTANTGVGKCISHSMMIRIRHQVVVINDREYMPWDKIAIDHGEIFACDVREDLSTLSIQRKVIERDVQIGQLFDEMGVPLEEDLTIPAEFDVDVLTPLGFKKIEACILTEKLPVRRVEFGFYCDCLEGADDHVVLTVRGWKRLADLKVGDFVQSEHCLIPVLRNYRLETGPQILYDLQVEEAQCYYANGYLSHNSHVLVNFGAHALRQGRNVLHYTFELSDFQVGIRYDSNLCNIPNNEVVKNKDLIKETYEKMDLGRLIIKEYPSGSASVLTLRSHIEKLLMKSFKPSLILIDYADIMRSTRRYDSMRHELKLIYTELRNLAQEFGVPIWTASQANRASADSDIVGLENMSEAYGKAMVADVVISLSRKAREKATGFGRMFVAKNRAGRDGLLFHIKMDTSRSMISVVDPDEEQTFLEAVEEDDQYARNRLNEVYQSLKRELRS